MAWVTIKGRRYYRRSKRVGGRVVTQHLGGGELGEAMAAIDLMAREDEREVREYERSERAAEEPTFAEFFRLDDVLASVVGVLAHRQGWHQHKRQWRRKRGAVVGSINKIRRQIERLKAKVEARPLITIDLKGLPDAERVMLAKAATGDAEALAAAEPYFKDAARLRRWGDPVHAAKCWLVTQSCGDDWLVGRATHRFAESMQEGLGWADADALQRLAILRVVNNWLAVGVLEAKANRINPEHSARTPIERALSQAEKRLMQAVRMLAVLRGTKPVDVMSALPPATAS